MDKRAIGLIIALVVVLSVVFMQHFYQTSPSGIKADNNKTKGAAFGSVQIVEYSDFQCPACKRAQRAVEDILEKYKGKVRLIYRHFPLDGHRWAKLAHQAGECAARQGKFWEYHDILYGEQEKWSFLPDPTQTFFQYGKDTDLNLDKFGSCMADKKVTESIFDEKKEGTNLQVRSTPTFFIRDQRFVGGVELQKQGEAYIREVLGLPAET